MTIIGSSNIYSSGFTGNTGPTGNAGATGNTGATGSTGNGTTGNSGAYVVLFTNDANTDTLTESTTITLHDNTNYTFTSDVFRGITQYLNDGITHGGIIGINFFSGLSFEGSGATKYANLKFKNIVSTTDKISITSDANFIYVNATGGTLTSTFKTANSLIYYNGLSSLGESTVGVSGTTSSYYLNVNSTLSFDVLVSLNENITRISNNENLLGITLDLSSSSVLEYRYWKQNQNTSPSYPFTLNLLGFTGFPGSSGTTGEIISATLILSDAVTHFPQNIWFRPDEAYLPCGTSIIGISSKNNGSSWMAEFLGKGYDINLGDNSCVPSFIEGACLSSNDTASTTVECEDYVSYYGCRNNFTNSGKTAFYPMKTCTELGQSTDTLIGNCCIKGKCQLVPKNLCLKYGGRYWGVTPCSESEFCYDPCNPPNDSACKTTGGCFERYTALECNAIGGTTAVDCTLASVLGSTGACCNLNKEPNCTISTQSECTSTGGIFNSGKLCSQIQCDPLASTTYNTTTNFTKNVQVMMQNGTVECFTLVGTQAYLSQFKEC